MISDVLHLYYHLDPGDEARAPLRRQYTLGAIALALASCSFRLRH